MPLSSLVALTGFAPAGTLTIGSPQDLLSLSFDYSYDPFKSNLNARTLQSMSTSAKEQMYDCANCPYDTYQKFYNYYGAFDYGNEWILAAFNKGATNFINGNADFGAYGDADVEGAVEGLRKGTVYLNVFMEVVKSMESAVDDCLAGCDYDNCDGKSKTNSWDEAVAFYVGSETKVSDGQQGKFLYTHANKRCRNFGTCDDDSGEALANAGIMEEFQTGQMHLFNGQCDDAKHTKEHIVSLMAAPLIQGTLRFAYMMGKDGIDDARADATGATYAASVLPFVHACSPVDAQIIHSNMRVGVSSPNFEEVKAAFERSYSCMGLSCEEIGGLLGDSDYMEGAEPCVGLDFSDTVSIANTTQVVESETVATSSPSTDSTTEIAEPNTTETTSFAVDANPEDCPPCSTSVTNPAFVAARNNMECPNLLSDQSNRMAQNCQCSCFVDSIFAFCAQPGISYSGDGSLIGPCEIFKSGNSQVEEEAPVVEETPVAEATEFVGETTNATATLEDEDDGSDEDANLDSEPEPLISLVQETSSVASVVLIGSFFAATAVSMFIMM